MAASFFQVIQYRSEFEEITNRFEMPYGSNIDNIEWFIENGHRSNRLRDGFDEAMSLAIKIKEYADGCAEEVRKWKQV